MGTDDTLSIQNAINYLNLHSTGLGFVGAPIKKGNVRGGMLQTSFTLYLPGGVYVDYIDPESNHVLSAGKYKITQPLELPDYLGLKGDDNAMLLCDDPTKPILRVGGYYNIIQGIGFAGGLNHVVFYGPASARYGGYLGYWGAAAPNVIRECTFRYPAGPCIYQYTGEVHDRDGRIIADYRVRSGASIVVEDCHFTGACFFWGAFDGATFRGCYVEADMTDAPLDDSGRPLAVWNSTDVLNVEDVLGVPGTGPDTARQSAWFQGSGTVRFSRMRFGGESKLTGIRIRTDMTYKTISLPMGDSPGAVDDRLAKIYVKESQMWSFGDLNWLEIYENFPAVIDLRNPVPVGPYQGIPYSDFSIFGTMGVWVDERVSMDSIAGQSKNSILIHIEGFQSGEYEPTIFYDALRFRQSSDPGSREGVDLWPYLRQFLDMEPWPFANFLYPATGYPQNNLYYPDTYDLSQHVSVINHGLSHGSRDHSTGYPLTVYKASEPGCYIAGGLGTTSHPLWGQGLPAGEYVLSMYVKANWTGQVTLGHGQGVQATRSFVSSHRYERIWFPFYHDGNAEALTLGVHRIPNDAEFSIGLVLCVCVRTSIPTHTLSNDDERRRFKLRCSHH